MRILYLRRIHLDMLHLKGEVLMVMLEGCVGGVGGIRDVHRV